MQLTILKPKTAVFALEPFGCYLINLTTGDALPVKESAAEAALLTPSTAFIRAPGAEQLPVCFIQHNLAEGDVRVTKASQCTISGVLQSQGDWEFTPPANPLRLGRNWTVRMIFPSGVIIELGWQKD